MFEARSGLPLMLRDVGTRVACVLMVWSVACVQAQYRFRFTEDFPGNALTGPKVGMVVMVDAQPSAAKESDEIVAAFQEALASELKSRGYLPTPVHSEVLKESITDSLGYPTHGRILQFRPLIEKNAIRRASDQGLSGVFVVWVSVNRSIPAQQFSFGNMLIDYRGNLPILWGTAMVEVFSSRGEGLRFFGGDIRGIQKSDPSAPGGDYRVQSPVEAAAATLRIAFSNPRSVLPYTR